MRCFRDSLQRLVEHETGVDPTIISIPFGRRRRTDPLAVLSAREREVLGLVGEGLSAGPSQRLSVRAVEQERSGLLTERVAASEGDNPQVFATGPPQAAMSGRQLVARGPDRCCSMTDSTPPVRGRERV